MSNLGPVGGDPERAWHLGYIACLIELGKMIKLMSPAELDVYIEGEIIAHKKRVHGKTP